MSCEDHNIILIIVQAIALFLSEIMPFARGTSNGLTHYIYNILTSGCLQPTPEEDPPEIFTSITTNGNLREERIDTFT